MPLNKRSQLITQGVQRSPNRAMLRAVGFKDADFRKPILGIANGYSTITPCNLGLNDLTRRAEAAAMTRWRREEQRGRPWSRPEVGACLDLECAETGGRTA